VFRSLSTDDVGCLVGVDLISGLQRFDAVSVKLCDQAGKRVIPMSDVCGLCRGSVSKTLLRCSAGTAAVHRECVNGHTQHRVLDLETAEPRFQRQSIRDRFVAIEPPFFLSARELSQVLRERAGFPQARYFENSYAGC